MLLALVTWIAQRASLAPVGRQTSQQQFRAALDYCTQQVANGRHKRPANVWAEFELATERHKIGIGPPASLITLSFAPPALPRIGEPIKMSSGRAAEEPWPDLSRASPVGALAGFFQPIGSGRSAAGRPLRGVARLAIGRARERISSHLIPSHPIPSHHITSRPVSGWPAER